MRRLKAQRKLKIAELSPVAIDSKQLCQGNVTSIKNSPRINLDKSLVPRGPLYVLANLATF